MPKVVCPFLGDRIGSKDCLKGGCILWDSDADYKKGKGCCTWQKIARDLSEIREEIKVYLKKAK